MLFKSLLLYICVSVVVLGAELRIDPSTNFLTNLMGTFRGPNAINITQFLTTFRMPSCMKQCLPEIDGLLRALAKSNETGDFATICSELQSSTHCASSAGCSKVFLDAATSAFQFVCLDNIQALSESMECVKETAMDSQPECEAHCSVQSRIIEDASNNSLEAIFEVPRLCNSTRCLLTCFKNKIDSKCRIGGRNVLDSLLSSVVRGEDHGFENTLDWIMPESCKAKSAKDVAKSNSTSPLNVGQVSRGNSSKTSAGSAKNNRVPTIKPTDTKSDPVTVRLPPATKDRANEPVEAALIIDGEIRTLRYQLLDWQGNPVQTPDFENLAKIMTLQLLPFKFPAGRPRETVILPTENDEKAGSKRLDEKIAQDEENVDKKSGRKKTRDGDDWRSEDGSEVVPKVAKEGVGVAIGLLLFALSVCYWAWEAARDIY